MGGLSGCEHERPRSRQAWSWDPQPGRPLPASTWGPLSGADPGFPPGPPRLPLHTHLRRSSRGSRPAPALLPSPGPAGDGRAGEGRAPQFGGRSGPKGCANGGRRARAQQEPLRAARAGLSPGWEDRDTAARLPPATAPPLTNQIGPQQRPVRPRLSLIGRRGSGGSSSLPGGGASSAQWGRESSRLPQQLRTRLSGPDGLRGSAESGAGSRPGVSRPSWPQLPHLPNRVNAPHEVILRKWKQALCYTKGVTMDSAGLKSQPGYGDTTAWGQF